MRICIVLPILFFALATASLGETRDHFADVMNKHGLTHFSEKTNFVERAISSRAYAGEWNLMELGLVLKRCMVEYQKFAPVMMQKVTFAILTDDAFLINLDHLVDELNAAEKKTAEL